MERTDYLFSRREVRQLHGLGRYAAEACICTSSKSWSICSCTAAAVAKASSMSWSSSAAPTTSRPFLPGLIDVEKLGIHGYDEKNEGPKGRFAGSKRAKTGG